MLSGYDTDPENNPDENDQGHETPTYESDNSDEIENDDSDEDVDDGREDGAEPCFRDLRSAGIAQTCTGDGEGDFRENDDDYSSDASMDDQLPRDFLDESRDSVGNRVRGESTSTLPAESIPYRHDPVQESPSSETVSHRSGGRLIVKDLVKYSAGELLARAWPLVSDSVKCATHPPFDPLPELPNIFQVRRPSTDELACFVRSCALQFEKRQTGITPIMLRMLLVKNVMAIEASRVPNVVPSMTSACADEVTGPDWNDNAITNAPPNVPVIDGGALPPIDWSFALTLDQIMISEAVMLRFHHLMDCCGFGSSDAALQSWGIKVFTQKLIANIDDCLSGSPPSDDRWLTVAVSLSIKLCMAQQSVDQLLLLLRLLLRHADRLSEVEAFRWNAWAGAFRSLDSNRVRVPLPRVDEWIPTTSLFHAFPETFRTTIAVHALCHSDSSFVLFTNCGVFRIEESPPFQILMSNTDLTFSSPANAFCEKELISVSTSSGRVLLIDGETLKVNAETDRSGSIYAGHGIAVKPHWIAEEGPRRKVIVF